MATRKITVWDVVSVSLILMVVLYIIMPVYGGDRITARKSACVSNLKQVELGLLMYSTDMDDRLPPSGTWGDVTMPYVKNGSSLYNCPELEPRQDHFGHAFYSVLSLRVSSKIQNPVTYPMTFDSTDLQWNANGILDLLPPNGRHKNGTDSMGFLDGHVIAKDRIGLYRMITEPTSGNSPP